MTAQSVRYNFPYQEFLDEIAPRAPESTEYHFWIMAHWAAFLMEVCHEVHNCSGGVCGRRHFCVDSRDYIGHHGGATYADFWAWLRRRLAPGAAQATLSHQKT